MHEIRRHFENTVSRDGLIDVYLNQDSELSTPEVDVSLVFDTRQIKRTEGLRIMQISKHLNAL